MDIDEALLLAKEIWKTGERSEIVPTKDGADVFVLKRRKVKPNKVPRPKSGPGRTESG